MKTADSTNARVLATETLLARVVGPAQLQIIHPPDLRLSANGDVDAQDIEVLEVFVEVDGDEIAVVESWASRNRGILRADGNGILSGVVVSVADEGEDAVRT